MSLTAPFTDEKIQVQTVPQSSEWQDGAQTHFSASDFIAFSHFAPFPWSRHGALAESKEASRLKPSPPKPCHPLTAGKINRSMGDHQTAVVGGCRQAAGRARVSKRGLCSDQEEWNRFPALRKTEDFKRQKGRVWLFWKRARQKENHRDGL